MLDSLVRSGGETIEAVYKEGQTLPLDWYYDPQIYDLERESFFHDSWHPVGAASALAEPGDHIVGYAADIPVVVVRGQDHQLHGFVNLCRHRGHPVALGNGRSSTLQCRYHAWTYDLDGSLRAAPRCEIDPNFDRSSISLLPVSVDSWNETIWANVNPSAGSIRDIGELLQLADEFNVSLEDYEFTDTVEYEVDANWKLWLENATECYHCATVHGDTYGNSFKDADDKRIARNGIAMAAEDVVTPHRSTVFKQHGREPNAKGLQFIYLWPSTLLGMDGYMGFVSSTVPVGPERSRWVYHNFVRRGLENDEFLADWRDMYDRTYAEDQEVVRAQHKAIRTGGLQRGRLSAHADRMTRHMQQIYLEAIQRASAGA